MSDQSAAGAPGEILTFYSYKGGTGRSMVLANTACLLAQQPEGHGGVLMVDWDLEAPGLHRYFADRFSRRFDNKQTASADLESHPGLIDFFIALAAEIDKLPPITEEPTPEIQAQLRHAVNLDSYILPTDVPDVYLLKAGAFDETYAKRVNTFAWEPLYHRAPWMITLVADWFTSRFRYTLIDSRTGITDTSGICTMLLPDKLVAVFTPNQQSLDGVLQMVERSTNYRRRSSDLRPLSVFPLPSRIEASEPELRERWRKGTGTGYQPRFEALFRKIWELDDCNLDGYFNEVQIQHASAYAYGEKVAVLLEKGNDRTSLRRAYVSFVERLALDEPWDTLAPSTAIAGNTATADIAESVYAALKPGEQDAAKKLFLQLVSLIQDSLKPAAREREVKTLADARRSMVEAFVAARVLAFREADPKTTASPADDSLPSTSSRWPTSWRMRATIFLTDESLPSTWRRLSGWIAADLDFLRWRTALEAARADWDKFGRPKDGLLRSRPLTEAESWLISRTEDVNPFELEYIKASIQARKRRKILTWTLSLAAGAAGIVGVSIYAGLRAESARFQAQAVLELGGIDAAIRAERLYPAAPAVEKQLRTLLGQLPPVVAVLPGSSDAVAGLLFNEDGTRLAVNYSDHVTGFSLNSSDAPFTVQANQVQSVVFGGGGKWLAVGAADGTRTLRNLQTGKEDSVPVSKPVERRLIPGSLTIEPAAAVTAIAFNADASRIATGTENGDIYLSTIPDTTTIHVAHKARINALAFSPSGQVLASASNDRTAKLWASNTGQNFAIFEHGTPVYTVDYRADGRAVATSSADRNVWLWRSDSILKGPPLLRTPLAGPGFFSPDGRYLARLSQNGGVFLTQRAACLIATHFRC